MMAKVSKSVSIPGSEITPYPVYLSRREFIRAAGLASGAALLAACAPESQPAAEEAGTPSSAGDPPRASAATDELGAPLNSFADITNYNNFYEFSTDKQAVNALSTALTTHPWTVEVGGLVAHPRTYSIEDLKAFPHEERIYRLRCVEGWSMVIPWEGFTLSSLLKEVEPTSEARYVRFETAFLPKEMPGLKSPFYPWPYQEGLRLDEAMNDLAILATGMYGIDLPKPDGAPVRLVVPWKYGFKSIKSIVKIELVRDQPATLWSTVAPGEYGFYSNVNPTVDHPRWSQASERRIGEFSRRPTLMFNGYAEQVAYLYDGMDLAVNY
jgi:sulfoxide reductase catalytic subunit YedY